METVHRDCLQKKEREREHRQRGLSFSSSVFIRKQDVRLTQGSSIIDVIDGITESQKYCLNGKASQCLLRTSSAKGKGGFGSNPDTSMHSTSY